MENDEDNGGGNDVIDHDGGGNDVIDHDGGGIRFL